MCFDVRLRSLPSRTRLNEKRLLRSVEARLAEMSSMGIGNKPCLDIRPSADQINDRSISVAQLSKSEYRRCPVYRTPARDSNINWPLFEQHLDLGIR